MTGYYLCVSRKDHSKSSTYINQICSDVYLSRDAAILEAKRRTITCRTKIVLTEIAVFDTIPNGTYFFQIKEVNIISQFERDTYAVHCN